MFRRGGWLVPIIVASSLAAPARADTNDTLGSDTWNGKKVYLSPALHTPDNEGCDGFLESANARETALATATELQDRGYAVRVGTGDFSANTDDSNAWGADAHIPIHSNGGVEDCESPFNPANGGTLVMFHPNRSASQALANQIESAMDSKSPGTNDRTCPDWCSQFDSLHEVRASSGIPAYVEVAYHTYRPDVDWMRGEERPARAIARGIDRYFGYPRSCGQPPCPESLLARAIDDVADIVEDYGGTPPGLPGDPGSLDPIVQAILDLVDQVDPGPLLDLVNQLLDTLVGTVDPAALIQLVNQFLDTLIGTVDPAALIQVVNQLLDTLIGIVDPTALIELVSQLLETVIDLVDPAALIQLVSQLLETVIGLVDVGELIELASRLLETLIGIVDINQLIDTVCQVLQTVIQCGGLPPVAASLALPGASGPVSPV